MSKIDYDKYIPCVRKYELDLTDEQKDFFIMNFNCNRFIYNLALESKMSEYDINMSQSKNKRKWKSVKNDLVKEIPKLKKENEWLKEPISESLQQSLRNLDTAFTNFFEGRSNYPKFKSKYTSKKSINLPHITSFHIDWDKQTITLPKIGEVKFKMGKNEKFYKIDYKKIQSVNVTQLPNGRFTMTVKFHKKELEPKPEKKEIDIDSTIGIDVGLIDYITTNSNDTVPTPKYFQELQSKLAKEQRKLSKMERGSENYKKQAIKVNKIHQKIKNKRLDFLHKLSHLLVVKNNQINTICIEDLTVKNMMKNRRLSKAIGNAAWSTFFRLLNYKADWHGVNVLVANKRFASSKTCSGCQKINKELTLSDRTFKCPSCHLEIPRDVNAAINLIIHCFTKYNLDIGGGVHHLDLEGTQVTLKGHLPSGRGNSLSRRENLCRNTPSFIDGGEVSCLVETEICSTQNITV